MPEVRIEGPYVLEDGTAVWVEHTPGVVDETAPGVHVTLEGEIAPGVPEPDELRYFRADHVDGDRTEIEDQAVVDELIKRYRREKGL